MEVAGVVLGAIPLIIHALNGYQETYDTVQSFRRWGDTLATLKSDIFLQKRQIFTTLGTLDLSITEGTTMEELEAVLQISHPVQSEDIMRIITQMNALMNRVASNLYPDANGPPTWAETKSDRITWEWRRVKRSFGSKERKQIIKQLQAWNIALQNCGLERREALPDTENRIINRVKSTFDPDRTETIRKNAQLLHEVIHSSWGCTCSQEHRSNIELNWHKIRPLTASTFNVALASYGTTQTQKPVAEATWMLVSANVEESTPTNTTTIKSDTITPPQDPSVLKRPKLPNTTSSPDNLGASLARMISSPVSASFPKRSKSVSVRNLSVRSPKVNFQIAPSEPEGSLSVESSSKASMKSITPVSEVVLCSTIALRPKHPIFGIIPIPGSDPCKQIRMTSTDISTSSNVGATRRAIQLHTVLSRRADQAISQRLNRKQRFGIAAALAWAVLHLCGSPWLEDTLSDEDVHVFLEQTGNDPSPRISNHPYLSYTFRLPPLHTGSSNTTTAKDPEFHSKQIQNMTLYTLAIRLIELGLNKPFADIRREYNASVAPQTSSYASKLVDDFDVAQHQIAELILDPGISYGHAVDRCLRFLFPGPPQRNTFEYAAFRSTFFADVVAPIQAAYELIPFSASQFGH